MTQQGFKNLEMIEGCPASFFGKFLGTCDSKRKCACATKVFVSRGHQFIHCEPYIGASMILKENNLCSTNTLKKKRYSYSYWVLSDIRASNTWSI